MCKQVECEVGEAWDSENCGCVGVEEPKCGNVKEMDQCPFDTHEWDDNTCTCNKLEKEVKKKACLEVGECEYLTHKWSKKACKCVKLAKNQQQKRQAEKKRADLRRQDEKLLAKKRASKMKKLEEENKKAKR